MAINTDDEILQDFLVEAGEILEELNEQLVDLEHRPDDYDLLNTVFRGFHTIKGGAGFLGIDALVTVCHRAEDVFNVLRQGQRSVDAELMDAVLQVLDEVNGMFALVHDGEEPSPADPALIATLEKLARPQDAVEEEAGEAEIPEAVAEEEVIVEEPQPQTQESEAVDKTAAGDDDITEEEFEDLLDQLHGEGKFGGVPSQEAVKAASQSSQPKPTSESDDITEEEFDALLDQLHGKGKHGGIPNQGGEQTAPAAKPAASQMDSEDITEEEFDALLDELHGKGKHGGVPKQTPAQPQGLKESPGKEPVKKEPVKQEAKQASAPAKAKTTPPPSAGAAGAAAKKSAASADTTVRVDTARLDDIMNMVGELVLVRNRLATLRSRLDDEEVINAVSNLDVVTADLQNSVMKTRMLPVKKVFGRFPRVVRDLARSLKKEINLELEGEETDLDKNLVEALADPMVHLVRNAVDHGIELPSEREKAGKPRAGTVRLSAAQEGDHILLTITDDGKGMDPAILRAKAVEKGMMDEEAAARLTEKDLYNLIFHPGFSTKTEISDVSGRGVGMDVVKTRIAQMNGSVEIDSELGTGSMIVIKLPLTLAILPTLMVKLGTQPFALPLSTVVEIFNLNLDNTNVVDGQLTIMVRERALPLFYLSKWLIHRKAEDREPDYSVGHVVVVNVGGIQIGLVVDHLIGQEEVVIKPLGSMLQGLDGMAGATITGDGNIALILDVPGLLRKYARRF